MGNKRYVFCTEKPRDTDMQKMLLIEVMFWKINQQAWLQSCQKVIFKLILGGLAEI